MRSQGRAHRPKVLVAKGEALLDVGGAEAVGAKMGESANLHPADIELRLDGLVTADVVAPVAKVEVRGGAVKASWKARLDQEGVTSPEKPIG